ncbi:sensor histidine kinase [Undibacterium oligocarboniphilum]|uniref:histidine kinase n=1 Tax=Undibacterium oligocarboniphilum TaxID=666702 RepID=A0A850QQY4_9BURK|nr:sensor histidine kinase [Undibacterium oligocarboniphilum]MBC3870732.1 sensor histidine kinase [Undibacterium oligocarboniphilum]NVO78466.1 sensor histidine kinase [Undibacterium oligocarboniphilum]
MPAHQPSIRRSLLKWLIAPLLVVNFIGAALVYWLAWTPAQTAFDQSLADTCWALSTRLHKVANHIGVDLPSSVEQVLRVDHVNVVYFVIRSQAGDILAGDKDFPAVSMPVTYNDSIFADGRMRGEAIRIVSIKFLIGDEPVVIHAAETLSKRKAIQSRIFITLITLEIILTVLLISVVWIAVTRGLTPLQNLQQELNRRNFDELSPLPEMAQTSELHPVTQAINRLLHKIEIGSTNQQDFLANIAHQLRTPLAGLKAQIEWIQERYKSDQETSRSASLMMISTERMIRQTNQLLALARAEPGKFERKRLEPLSLNQIIAESIHVFFNAADRKHIDLGFDLQPVMILGDAFLLRDLIENIIDNAISYTPENGIVTVRCHSNADGTGVFSVEDNGPGIPAAERKHIFERRYRINERPAITSQVSGNGLGLSIVSDIAKDHDARIELQDARYGGTVFLVEFPPVPHESL